MTYRVDLLAAAESDLEDIASWIAEHDSRESAGYVLNGIMAVVESLTTMPTRGRLLQEMRDLGDETFREVMWKPYRIVCEVENRDVLIHGIFDGRRDLKTAYERRLMR